MAAVDPQSLREPPRSAAEFINLIEAASGGHPLYAGCGCQSTDQHGASGATDDIGAPVDAIAAIDIDGARFSEHRAIARGRAAKAVRSGVVGSVSLCLDDRPAHAVDQEDCADEPARDVNDIGVEIIGG